MLFIASLQIPFKNYISHTAAAVVNARRPVTRYKINMCMLWIGLRQTFFNYAVVSY